MSSRDVRALGSGDGKRLLTVQDAACMRASTPWQSSAKKLLSVDSPTTATFLPMISGPQTCKDQDSLLQWCISVDKTAGQTDTGKQTSSGMNNLQNTENNN